MGIHIFHESGELCELLRDPRRKDKSATSSLNLDNASLDEVLNRAADGDSAYSESREQFILGRKSVSGAYVSSGDIRSQNLFDLSIKWNLGH
jgi:hypothetical protein